MGRFEIEFAQFTKVVVDAETEEEAKDLAAIMDGEEIAEHDTHEYNIDQHKRTKRRRVDPSAGAADPAGDSVGIFTETMWIKG